MTCSCEYRHVGNLTKKGTIMSIYIDPEEYYEPQEPDKLSEESDKYLRSVLMAIDWYQQDVAEREVDQEVVDEPIDEDFKFPEGGYKFLGSIYSLGEYLDE